MKRLKMCSSERFNVGTPSEIGQGRKSCGKSILSLKIGVPPGVLESERVFPSLANSFLAKIAKIIECVNVSFKTRTLLREF